MTASRSVKSLGETYFSLDDGEVDLDLVQPGGVHRGMHHDRVRVLLGQPVDRGLATVGGSVVDNPEHPIGGCKGWWLMTVGLVGGTVRCRWWARSGRTPWRGARHRRPGRRSAPPAAVVVARVDPHRAGLAGRERGVAATPGLDGGLLVGRDHIIVAPQWFPVPHPVVEVEHSRGFGGEVGIGDEDPRPVRPGFRGRPRTASGAPSPSRWTRRSPAATAWRASSGQLHRDIGVRHRPVVCRPPP